MDRFLFWTTQGLTTFKSNRTRVIIVLNEFLKLKPLAEMKFVELLTKVVFVSRF